MLEYLNGPGRKISELEISTHPEKYLRLDKIYKYIEYSVVWLVGDVMSSCYMNSLVFCPYKHHMSLKQT